MENPKSRRINNLASRIRLNARPSLHVSLWHNRCDLVDAPSFIFPLVPESVFFHYLLGEESHNADLHQSEGRYLVNRFFIFINECPGTCCLYGGRPGDNRLFERNGCRPERWCGG